MSTVALIVLVCFSAWRTAVWAQRWADRGDFASTTAWSDGRAALGRSTEPRREQR